MINRLEIYSNINAGSGDETKIVEQVKKDIKDK